VLLAAAPLAPAVLDCCCCWRGQLLLWCLLLLLLLLCYRSSNQSCNSTIHQCPIPYASLHLSESAPAPKYEWRSLVYTDGSQRKIDTGPNGRQTLILGSGICVPRKTGAGEAQCISIQSTAPTRHNTTYRAELVGILGALQQGYLKSEVDGAGGGDLITSQDSMVVLRRRVTSLLLSLLP
jgi:hypothetical protein